MKCGNSAFFLSVLSTLIASVYPQLLHPIDHVTGSWKINLKRKDRKLLDLMVFPPQTCSIPTPETISTSPLSKSRRKSLNCELILDANGTFTLNPPTDEAEDSIQTKNGVISKLNRLPLTGHWILNPNPYCVTDRQYDELTLISSPKTRFSASGQDSGNSYMKEKVSLEMHCKVWGRFGSNTIRALMKLPRAREAGRLTHGTLSIKKDLMKYEKAHLKPVIQTSRRVVCATFHAKARSQKITKK